MAGKYSYIKRSHTACSLVLSITTRIHDCAYFLLYMILLTLMCVQCDTCGIQLTEGLWVSQGAAEQAAGPAGREGEFRPTAAERSYRRTEETNGGKGGELVLCFLLLFSNGH